jgi:hypothetical protein
MSRGLQIMGLHSHLIMQLIGYRFEANFKLTVTGEVVRGSHIRCERVSGQWRHNYTRS